MCQAGTANYHFNVFYVDMNICRCTHSNVSLLFLFMSKRAQKKTTTQVQVEFDIWRIHKGSHSMFIHLLKWWDNSMFSRFIFSLANDNYLLLFPNRSEREGDAKLNDIDHCYQPIETHQNIRTMCVRFRFGWYAHQSIIIHYSAVQSLSTFDSPFITRHSSFSSDVQMIMQWNKNSISNVMHKHSQKHNHTHQNVCICDFILDFVLHAYSLFSFEGLTGSEPYSLRSVFDVV